jgi:hypothetical protein
MTLRAVSTASSAAITVISINERMSAVSLYFAIQARMPRTLEIRQKIRLMLGRSPQAR